MPHGERFEKNGLLLDKRCGIIIIRKLLIVEHCAIILERRTTSLVGCRFPVFPDDHAMCDGRFRTAKAQTAFSLFNTFFGFHVTHINFRPSNLPQPQSQYLLTTSRFQMKPYAQFALCFPHATAFNSTGTAHRMTPPKFSSCG